MSARLCPLAVWLEHHDVPVVRFARQTGLSKKTVYNLLNGSNRFRIDTLLAVQEATGGEVTVDKMADWVMYRLCGF